MSVTIKDINFENKDAVLKDIKEQALEKSINYESIDVGNAFLYPTDKNSNLKVTCENMDKNLRELLSDNCYNMTVTQELNKDRLHYSEPFIMASEDAIQGLKIIDRVAKLDPDPAKTLKIGFSFNNSISLPQEIDYKSIAESGSVMKAYSKQVEQKIDKHFNDAIRSNNELNTDNSDLTASHLVALYSKAFKVDLVDKKINSYLKEKYLEGGYERSTDRAFKNLDKDLNNQLAVLRKSQKQYGNKSPEVLKQTENELLGQLKGIGGVKEKISGLDR